MSTVDSAAAPDASQPVSRSQARTAVGLLALFELLSGFIQGGTTQLIPQIRDSFDLSTGQAQLIAAVQLLGAALCAPVFGRLGDRTGHRRLLRWALGFITLGSVLVALAPGLPLLLAGRVLLGPLAALLALEIGLCRTRLPPQYGRQAVSVLVSTLALGSLLGALATGPVSDLVGGVRPMLWVFALLAALCLALSFTRVPESTVRAHGTMDWAGALLLSAALILFLAGISQVNSSPLPSAAAVVAGLLLFTLWVGWERRVMHPLVDVRASASRAMAPHLLSALAFGVVMLAAPVVCVSYLDASAQDEGYGFGLASWQIGVCIALPQLLSFAGAALAASVAARLGLRRMLTLAFLLTAAGHLALLAVHDSLPLFLLAYAIAAAGMGLALGGLPSAVVEASTPDRVAGATAVYNNLKTVGGSIASTGFAALLGSWVLGGTGSPALGAYLTIWGVCAAVTLLALLATLTMPTRD
ncbi:MFS transporter [Streptomyces sp. NPDC087440]|uniref:MFS transporter n=1 Tax=Streptomyces sp. NPDC087440 TaxID=3365790 RepID=UPI0038212D6D